MSSAVVKINEFNVANVTIGQIKALESGGKMANINYNGGKFTTQVGPLNLPYGMNVFDKMGPLKYSMDLSFRGSDDNEKVKQALDAFNALDEFMIEQGVKNSRAWFKSDLSRDFVKAFYTPIVKIAKDANGNPKPYPPTVKINLKKIGDNFEAKVYDNEKRPYEGVPLEDLLVKGSLVTSLIQCTSVWFAGSKFGLSWKALQIRMDKVPDSIRDYGFVDDAAEEPKRQIQRVVQTTHKDEDDEVFARPAPTQAVAVAQAPVQQKQSILSAMMPKQVADAAEDADNNVEDADDNEPVPVPKKTITTVKKIVKKMPVK